MTQGRTLSRDFKHVRRQVPGAQTFSGWVGLAAGLAIGLSVALGVFLHYRNLPAPEPTPAAAKPPASARAAEEPAPGSSDPSAGYTFYDDLPRQEVSVPPKETPASGRTAPGLPAGDVVLQAGSFKQAAEADKLQAKLAQYGIDSKIQRYALEDETWFRVRIGPIATVQDLDATRAKLAEAEVEATPVTPAVEVPPP